MQDAHPALPSLLRHANELRAGALKPGRHHHAFRVPKRRESAPLTGISPDSPVFDRLADGLTLNHHIVHLKSTFTSGNAFHIGFFGWASQVNFLARSGEQWVSRRRLPRTGAENC